MSRATLSACHAEGRPSGMLRGSAVPPRRAAGGPARPSLCGTVAAPRADTAMTLGSGLGLLARNSRTSAFPSAATSSYPDHFPFSSTAEWPADRSASGGWQPKRRVVALPLALGIPRARPQVLRTRTPRSPARVGFSQRFLPRDAALRFAPSLRLGRAPSPQTLHQSRR